MQPADTVSVIIHTVKGAILTYDTAQALTRMYNQPTKIMSDGRHVGLLYKNPIDCLWKTFKAEGPFGWYKGARHFELQLHLEFTASLGSTAHFLRIAPHTIITLTANDVIIGLYKRLLFGKSDEDD